MGRMLGSRYILDDVLGRGAFGVVWSGRARRGDTPLAFKILDPTVARDADALTRFIQERSILVGLDGPNLVRVHDLVVEGDTLAMVMDLVTGGDLRDVMRRAGVMGEREVCRIGAGIARGAASIHAAGVVHRDLKPENVLMDATGEGLLLPRITDFGIASIVGSGSRSTKMAGTPSYIAPELIENRPPTAASDLYSLGIILYELAVGHPPFRSDNVLAMLRMHADAQPERPDALSDPLWAVISTLLSKDPAQRGPGAGELADLLETLAGQLVDDQIIDVTLPARASGAPLVPSPLVESTVIRPQMPPEEATMVRPRISSPPPPPQPPPVTLAAPSLPPPISASRQGPSWGLVVGAMAAVFVLVAGAIIATALITDRHPSDQADLVVGSSEEEPADGIESPMNLCWDGAMIAPGDACSTAFDERALFYAFGVDPGTCQPDDVRAWNSLAYKCEAYGRVLRIAMYSSDSQRDKRLAAYGPCDALGGGREECLPGANEDRMVLTYEDPILLFYASGAAGDYGALRQLRDKDQRPAEDFFTGVAD